MTYIDDFIKSEESKMTWFDKVLGNYPRVRTTKFIAVAAPSLALGEKKVIKPSVLYKAIVIIVLPIPCLVWIGLLRLMLVDQFPFGVILFGLLLVSLIIYLLLYFTFFKKRYNYRITVDGEGITFDKNKFYWAEIAETGIMNRQEGKRTNSYLLIFHKDTTVNKYDLFNFGISDRKLAAIIEYYKKG
ncbi:hypothetical protein A3860_36925 [Niastella vici]|uniref:Uncharacterized protein n=1 Tax=Niastella vici TaxID=1703345 RepID=A0A1V9FMP1_9BACT|nr:hypothetical protein [Niastella vici]OQP59577.1 hypothetical protein A3860_36925 [Niastella vici]